MVEWDFFFHCNLKWGVDKKQRQQQQQHCMYHVYSYSRFLAYVIFENISMAASLLPVDSFSFLLLTVDDSINMKCWKYFFANINEIIFNDEIWLSRKYRQRDNVVMKDVKTRWTISNEIDKKICKETSFFLARSCVTHSWDLSENDWIKRRRT